MQATRLSVQKLPPHAGSLDPKAGSTLVNVTVGCLCIYESMSTAGVWCPILEPTSAVRRSTPGTDSGMLLPSARSSSKDSVGTDDFLVARVVLNPRDGGVNMQLQVTMAAISLDYRHWVFPHLAQCFSPPPGLRLDAVKETVSSTAVYYGQMSKAGLLHAMETHKTMDVQIQIGPPSIQVLILQQASALWYPKSYPLVHYSFKG